MRKAPRKRRPMLLTFKFPLFRAYIQCGMFLPARQEAPQKGVSEPIIELLQPGEMNGVPEEKSSLNFRNLLYPNNHIRKNFPKIYRKRSYDGLCEPARIPR